MSISDTQPKSKSQRKREHHALQALAESLVEMTPGQLASVPVSDNLRQGIVDASAMKKGALRRQVRYLARLLSEENPNAIAEAVERVHHGSREETARLHRIERWREQLIADEPGTLPAFIEAHPDADRQQLRQLVRAARQERERNAPPRAFRRLFVLLRDLEP